MHEIGENQFIARARHVSALREAAECLARADAAAQPEILAENLRQAQASLARITGEFTPDDLLGEIRKNAAAGGRVLVTTLTKRMAEDLTEHYEAQGVRVRYLHSDIDTMERVEILRDLRLGKFDVLVGINLLREGLDLPEVSLVAILDADKEGFLRPARSLVQTFGRAARNVSGRVILYADRETGSMREAMSETARRRERQVAYNRENGITPETIRKMIADPIGQACEADYVTAPTEEPTFASREELAKLLRKLRREMERAAKKLDFERAATLRDRLLALEKAELSSR
ncbi:MAG: hypothetical protein B7Z74_01800 [Deltaproteobacteria bacterium 21-66-5]|nr:MAG: hypothetical protein B7Z74_01800 [Deltaproteobacteria bacterium 21-66-5]